MKKLLVLALVLSMAAAANATLSISLSGPTTLEKNAVGTYTIGYAGVTNFGGYDLDIVSDQGAQPFGISGGAILTPASNRDTGGDIVGINTTTSNYEISAENFTLTGGTDMGSPLATFSFTAGSVVGIVNISLLENSDFFDNAANSLGTADMPSMAVTITPEPMTMCLLGLGGLLLRRRK
ncbi:MAG: hypothetical protein ABSG97_02835 [Sedimentisphaerales bacterium]